MELKEISRHLEEIKYAEAKIIKLKKALKDADEKKLQALKKLEKENKDVDKITGVTFQSFLATLLKNREEKIEKEELEAMEAKRQYDEIVYEVESLEDEINALIKTTSNKSNIEKEYEVIYSDKKEKIMSADPALWQQITLIDQEISKDHAMIKEIKEALIASNKVISASRNAMIELGEAKDYGVWDMMGGGLLATMAKRERMDKAQQSINNMKYAIKQFSSELEDIDERMDVEIDIASYMSVTDYLFDNFFVDMMVQDKINDSMNQVKRVTSKVEGMIIKLELRLDDVKGQLATNAERLDALIINS